MYENTTPLNVRKWCKLLAVLQVHDRAELNNSKLDEFFFDFFLKICFLQPSHPITSLAIVVLKLIATN